MLSQHLQNLLKRSKYKQASSEWLEARKKLITSSQVATILNANPYQSKSDLFKKKTKIIINPKRKRKTKRNNNKISQSFGNFATQWGIKYEAVAVEIYKKLFNKQVYHFGLIEDEKYKWLAGSPDGITEDNALLEIKCVVSRIIKNDPPLYYWIQCQILMQVCNLESCHLLECKFEESDKPNEDYEYYGKWNDNKYWYLKQYKCHSIKRDREWFKKNKDELYQFYCDINNESLKQSQSQRQSQSELSKGIFKKRKRNEDSESYESEQEFFQNRRMTRSDSKRLKLKDWKDWIYLHDIDNSIRNDTILDWLNLYGDPSKRDSIRECGFMSYLGSMQELFHKNVINYIERKNTNNYINIGTKNDIYSTDKYNSTKLAIQNKIPFIFNAIFHDSRNRTYGIIPLLVLGSHCETILEKNTFPEYIHDILDKDTYYPILIKNNTLQLTANGYYMLNNSDQKILKSYAWIMIQALYDLQGVIPKFSFVIGKKYQWTKQKKYYFESNCFHRFGIIDFQNTDIDINIEKKTLESIKWLKKCKKEGYLYNIESPGTISELYPNMKNTVDYPWSKYKKELAIKNNEITQIWNCGYKERKHCHDDKIFSWKDTQCNSDTMKLKSHKNKVDKILCINKSESSVNILPRRIKNNLNDWKNNKSCEFYIDFETTADFNLDESIFPKSKNYSSLIYMIGLGWKVNNTWNFKTFITDNLNLESEAKIIKQFIQKMYSLKNEYSPNESVNCYHWSPAELNFLNQCYIRQCINNYNYDFQQYFTQFKNQQDMFHWTDLMKIFTDEPIVIRNCFTFKLKHIAKSFYDHGYIKTIWKEENSVDGISAILAGIECDKQARHLGKKLHEMSDMQSIIDYNEIDCKVMWEIVDYLRKYHC